MATQNNAVEEAVEIICGQEKGRPRHASYKQFAPPGIGEFYNAELLRIAGWLADEKLRLDNAGLRNFATGVVQGWSFEKTSLACNKLLEEGYHRAQARFKFKSFTGFGKVSEPAYEEFFKKACKAVWIVIEGKSRDTGWSDSSMPNNGSEILDHVVDVFSGVASPAEAYKALIGDLAAAGSRPPCPTPEQFYEILDRIAGADDTPLTQAWKGISSDWHMADRDFIAVLRWREDNIGSHEPVRETESFKISPDYPKPPLPVVSFQAMIADIELDDFKRMLDGFRGPSSLLRLVVVSRQMLGNSHIKFHSVLDLAEKGEVEIVGFCPAMEKILKHQQRNRASTKIYGLRLVADQIAAVHSD